MDKTNRWPEYLVVVNLDYFLFVLSQGYLLVFSMLPIFQKYHDIYDQVAKSLSVTFFADLFPDPQ